MDKVKLITQEIELKHLVQTLLEVGYDDKLLAIDLVRSQVTSIRQTILGKEKKKAVKAEQ